MLRASLLQLANRRLILVGLLAIILSSAFALLAWRYTLDAHAVRVIEQTRQNYDAKVAEHRKAWHRAAQRLKAQIEFLRIGELPPEQRRNRLIAFFNAQGENREFAGILIGNSGGLPLYSLGCHQMLMESLNVMQMGSLAMEDVFMRGQCSGVGQVYSVTHATLWMGVEGKGLALFATALDNAYLARLARGQDTVRLVVGGRVMAASNGSAGLSGHAVSSGGNTLLPNGILRIRLPLDATEPETGPLLVIEHPTNPLLSTPMILLGVILTSLLFFALVWFGLGRAIRAHLGALVAISRGAAEFRRDYKRGPAWFEAARAQLERDDELGLLAGTLDQLMETAERRDQEQDSHLQTLDMLEEVVVELDMSGRISRISSGWAKVVGFDTGVVGRALADFLDPEDVPALANLIAALSRGDKLQATARLRLERRGEEERWLELRLALAAGHESLRGVLRDITQSYMQERRISHMALHDALTGLPNRVLLEDRLKVAMRLVERSRHKVALGFIDLDHFKDVNDSLGHKTGDQLLVALARRLREQLRQGDTLARWGGDEFIVLLPDMESANAIREVANKLRLATEAPLRVEENEFNLTFSAGFAVYPDDADDSELLLAHADRAMFYAKSQGRNNLQFFGDMSRKGLGRKDMYIQQRLAAAIREGRIDNHYQPLVEAATGRIVGVETLARWHEPDLGWVSPAAFIPMAENLGLIRELGEQVWRRALGHMRGWTAQGIGLSVNISKRQLFMSNFTERLLADARSHGIEPGRITLEITESLALLDVEYSAERLKELREAGFRLSIDDFGTGYSSLSQLHELPVHELKIDMAFVRRILTPQGARLIQTIVGMASTLGLETVAEGVEDQAVADILRDMGVDILQGWHFGRPMPAEELGARLAPQPDM